MSKIIFSTLLPRADIPLQTLLQINRQLISECSKLPNEHTVLHEKIFSKELKDILHDERHLKKLQIGLFAANLVNAIRGRAKQPRPFQKQMPHSSPPYHRGKISCYSAAVKNPENADLKQHPSPLHSHSEPRLPQQPMNWEVDNHASSHFQRQQQPTALQIPPHFTTGWQMPSKPHNSKDSYVELPQELIFFFRIVKSLLYK